MNPRPTGRVVDTARGPDLVITRQFRGTLDDVWTSVTDSASTARWFGPWEGEPGVGNRIRVQMAFEEGAPWSDATITACEAPRHLALSTHAGEYSADLEVRLEARGDHVELTFVHHLASRAAAGDYGPGWEYYLDMLVAARAGTALPSFSDYHPSQKAHFLEQTPSVELA